MLSIKNLKPLISLLAVALTGALPALAQSPFHNQPCGSPFHPCPPPPPVIVKKKVAPNNGVMNAFTCNSGATTSRVFNINKQEKGIYFNINECVSQGSGIAISGLPAPNLFAAFPSSLISFSIDVQNVPNASYTPSSMPLSELGFNFYAADVSDHNLDITQPVTTSTPGVSTQDLGNGYTRITILQSAVTSVGNGPAANFIIGMQTSFGNCNAQIWNFANPVLIYQNYNSLHVATTTTTIKPAISTAIEPCLLPLVPTPGG